MNDKLEEPISIINSEKFQENNGVGEICDEINEPLALPLSAFQKELEEAANEPLFNCGQSDVDEESSEPCCSETVSCVDLNETETPNLEDEELFEVRDGMMNGSTNSTLSNVDNMSLQRPFQFATPITNKHESKMKYTPSLMKIQEYSSKRVAIRNEILQTPNNNLLVSKTKNFKGFQFMSIDKKRIHIDNDNKVSNNKLNKTADDLNSDCPEPLFKNVHIDENRCIKQLSFNSLLTPASNRRDKPPETPKIQCTINFNLMKSSSIQNSAQKLIGSFLNTEEGNYGLCSDKKASPIHLNKENQQNNKKLPATTVKIIPTEKKSNFLDAEKKYLHSLKEDTKNADDGKSQQNKVTIHENNKENRPSNKPNGVISPSIDNDLKQFDKIVVNNLEYIVLNQLGKGGSSIVYHCFNAANKLQRAIKKVSLRGDKACVEGYINEVKMLHKLQNCDRIIQMYSYEILKSEKILYMVLEKGERDLSSILRDLSVNTIRLPIYMLIYYWMEMLFAVKQIHENGIIHSDLKPANFLVARGGLKLIDFGIASSLQTDMTSVVKNVQIGSFNYISPEALQNNSRDTRVAEFKISYKSDVWSLGCILYQLVYRKTPFQHIGHTFAKLSAIVDPDQKINYPDAEWVPPKIITTIKACLQYEMKARPSVDELIKEYDSYF